MKELAETIRNAERQYKVCLNGLVKEFEDGRIPKDFLLQSIKTLNSNYQKHLEEIFNQ